MERETKSTFEAKSTNRLRLLLAGALLATVALAGESAVANASGFLGGGLHTYADLYYQNSESVCYTAHYQVVVASDSDPFGTYFTDTASVGKYSGLQFLYDGYFTDLGFGWVSEAAEGSYATPFSC